MVSQSRMAARTTPPAVDEDVLVVAGGQAAPVLGAVKAALDDVASAVAVGVEVDRSATGRPSVLAVADLVGRLRDHCGDAAGAQPLAVRPGGSTPCHPAVRQVSCAATPAPAVGPAPPRAALAGSESRRPARGCRPAPAAGIGHRPARASWSSDRRGSDLSVIVRFVLPLSALLVIRPSPLCARWASGETSEPWRRAGAPGRSWSRPTAASRSPRRRQRR